MDDTRHPLLSAPLPPSVTAKSGADVGPGSDIFQRLLKERIVFIGSAIDQNTANLVCSQLILLEAEDHEHDISVYINSPGGSVTDGLAIYDTMPCPTAGSSCTSRPAACRARPPTSPSRPSRSCT